MLGIPACEYFIKYEKFQNVNISSAHEIKNYTEILVYETFICTK